MIYCVALIAIMLSVSILIRAIRSIVNANNISEQLLSMKGLLIYARIIIPILLIIESLLRYFNLY